MPTGACGINCDVCKLKLAGICSTCGPGRSQEAEAKLEAQERLLGTPCPMLACARMNRLDYCMRDCKAFPCENFHRGPYPFSRSFLDMQERRRKQKPPARTPQGAAFSVPEEFWDEIAEKKPEIVAGVSLSKVHPEGGIVVPHLGREVLVHPGKRRIFQRDGAGAWQEADYPLLELLMLVYLLNVTDEPVQNDMVSVSELKDAHFFQGPHVLKTAPLLERFGNDSSGFKAVARRLGGTALDMADAAFKFLPFPKVPLFYLLWEGDDEFPPDLKVLFDRSVEKHLSADALWGLVNLVSDEILLEG